MAKTVILGFTVTTSDLVVSRINLEKILKFIPSTTEESAGSKNELIVDFRIGFTESQSKMIFYTVGDIFAELGGLSASVKLVIGSIATLLVLSYIFDLQAMIKRKSAHKFRVLTIEKYRKCLPQIKKIIKTIQPDHQEYKDYMEDKASIITIKNTSLITIKNSTKVYDILRYLISKYSNLHNIIIPQDEERNMLIKLWDNRRSQSYK